MIVVILNLLDVSSFLLKNKKSHREANIFYISKFLSSGMIFAMSFLKAYVESSYLGVLG